MTSIIRKIKSKLRIRSSIAPKRIASEQVEIRSRDERDNLIDKLIFPRKKDSKLLSVIKKIRIRLGIPFRKSKASQVIAYGKTIEIKHKDEKNKLLIKLKLKISKHTKKPTAEMIKIDRKKGEKIHRVSELTEFGNWKTVHKEKTDLPKKRESK